MYFELSYKIVKLRISQFFKFSFFFSLFSVIFSFVYFSSQIFSLCSLRPAPSISPSTSVLFQVFTSRHRLPSRHWSTSTPSSCRSSLITVAIGIFLLSLTLVSFLCRSPLLWRWSCRQARRLRRNRRKKSMRLMKKSS